MIRPALLLVPVVLLAAAPGAPAQTGAPPVEVGSTVRLQLVADQRGERAQSLRGTVVLATADSLVLRLHREAGPVSIPAAWIARLEVSRGRAPAWQAAREAGVHGFLLGAGLGAFAGSEVAAATGDDFVETVLHRAAVYGLSLGATAALRSALAPGIRWERVELRGAPRRAAADAEQGWELGVRLAL